MLSSFPGLPTKSFLKFILHSNENDVMKFQFRFAWNARSSPAFGQRTSVDQLAQLSAAPINGFFRWRGLFQQRELEMHSFSAGMQRRDALHFVFKRRYRLRDRTCLEKDTNECSCLICDSSCCRTSCVSVQPCTPKVLPNTETFLHSRVFFVTCVVLALCQIMYSLSVCSDGTTEAAPRSFRQNRPPARTLSLTYYMRPRSIVCMNARANANQLASAAVQSFEHKIWNPLYSPAFPRSWWILQSDKISNTTNFRKFRKPGKFITIGRN